MSHGSDAFMQDRVRVAVIGTGWWATATHLPALRAMPDVDLVAVCDTSAERADAAATAFGIAKRYPDHRALLAAERPDAVVVATTHATHFAIAYDCLESGAHVLVEKPLTLLAEHARTLTERAAQAGRTLLTGYPWNYMSHALQVREQIGSGRFGDVQLVQSIFNSYNADLISGRDRSNQAGGYPVHGPGDVYSRKEHSGGGHGHLQMTHAAGLLFFITGLRISAVQARMTNHCLPLDLVDVMQVEFAGGALGSISGTSNSFLPKSALNISCESGGIEMDIHAGTTILRTVNGERETLPSSEQADLKVAPVKHLVGVARGAEPPGPGLEAGWRAVELLDAAYRSANSGGRSVSVEELYQPQA